jgi:hypothetical protein
MAPDDTVTYGSMPCFEHEFRVAHSDLWQYRSPDLWLTDLIETALLMPRIHECREQLRLAGRQADADRLGLVDCSEGQSLWKLTVYGPEWLLRFVCVALNQHALQSPSDPTPAEEANRLERTLKPLPPEPAYICATCRHAIFMSGPPAEWGEACEENVGIWTTEEGTWGCQNRSHPDFVVLHVPVRSEVVGIASKAMTLDDLFDIILELRHGGEYVRKMPVVVWDEATQDWRTIAALHLPLYGDNNDGDDSYSTPTFEMGGFYDSRFH